MKKLILILALIISSFAFSQNSRSLNIYSTYGINLASVRFFDAGNNFCVNDFVIYNNSRFYRSFSFTIYINNYLAYTGWASIPGNGDVVFYNQLFCISNSDTISVRVN